MREMKQQDGEPVDRFVMRMRVLAKKCNYGNEAAIEDHLIDQFIIGAKCDAVRKKLLDQDPSTLNLKTCLQYAQTYESTASQLHHMQQASVSAVKAQVKNNHRQKDGKKSRASHNVKTCGWCGGGTHDRSKCPAKDAECGKCKKIGHYARVCRSEKHQSKKKTSENFSNVNANTSPQELALEELQFDIIGTKDRQRTEAFANVRIVPYPGRYTHLHGKVDTGAQGNILPLRVYRQIYPQRVNNDGLPSTLKPSPTVLTAYNGTTIKQFGTITLDCQYQGSEWAPAKFYIADTTGPIIFGLPTCTAIGLVQMNCIVTTSDTSIKSAQHLRELYPDRFEGIGKLPGLHKLVLKENNTPVIHPPRRAPIQLKEKIRGELKRMEELDVIRPVTEPTSWVSSITYVMKKNGSLRICLDPKNLNSALKRGQHHIPTMEELAHHFNGATTFSKLDAKSGYWAIQLDDKSQILTTFNTPFGRFCYKRLPFGLNVSQDIFQAAMDAALQDLPGVISIADDIAVYGSTEEEHDKHLRGLLERAKKVGLIFNFEKCKVKCEEIDFFGNVYDRSGVRPDPEKVTAIKNIIKPTNTKELQSFLGMVTYLSSFIPHLSDHTAPLRSLLNKDSEFQWHPEHDKAFQKLKDLICQAGTLSYFNPNKPATLQVDASMNALGAALTQDNKVIAYASKSLSETEKRYANIEREMLACMFGAERFNTYLYGKPFTIESDHKPLEMISKKSLNAAPARLQRMLLRMHHYDYKICYKPGKEMTLADSLSRLPSVNDQKTIDLDVKVCMVQFSGDRLSQLRKATQEDPMLSEVIECVLNGFPTSKRHMSLEARQFWDFRDELAIEDGILLKGNQVCVPSTLHQPFLNDIHKGHLGITRCQQRARSTLYWPNMSKQIENIVNACQVCQRHQASLPKETYIPVATDLPHIPWYTLSTDLFTLDGETYLLIADYMSKFPVIEKLGNNLSSQRVADFTSKIISQFGVPHQIISDNGPQFIGSAYQSMLKQYGIIHTTSSPHHAQSHGFIERMVRTCKSLLKKSPRDSDMALLVYRTTPLGANILSPAQLLFGRRIASNLPIRVSGPADDAYRAKQHQQSEDLEKTIKRELPELQQQQDVFFQDVAKKTWSPGIVVGYGPEPRSYTLQCKETGKMLRRNRNLIRPNNEKKPDILTLPDMPEFQQDPSSSSNVNPSTSANDNKPQETLTSTSTTIVSEPVVQPQPKAEDSDVMTPAKPRRSGRTVRKPEYYRPNAK